MLAETDLRILRKFAWNFGYKSMRAVQLFKKRLKSGVYFPPFVYLSIINSCQLRCTGCWADVQSPRQMLSLDAINKVINQSKKMGNHFYGILGGEPLLHPNLLKIFQSHPDCYFQLFTNGHLLTDELASQLRQCGNVTPLISIEGSEAVSDERRHKAGVLNKTLAGIEACKKNRLIFGVATSVCKNNEELVSENWLKRLIELGAHYVWFYTYRPVGPDPAPDLALSPEEILNTRKFIVQMRAKLPIIIVDAYWDDQGRALCPMAIGISHHINPAGDIEPCPIFQFAAENIADSENIAELIIKSRFLDDCRKTAAKTSRGCIVLERPDLVVELAKRHQAKDSTLRKTGVEELQAMVPRTSQHNPGNEVPEDHWAYRFAKKHWFFGFGAYM